MEQSPLEIYSEMKTRRPARKFWASTLAFLELTPGRYKFWGREIQSEEPSVHYDEIMANDKGVAAWTAKIVGTSLL